MVAPALNAIGEDLGVNNEIEKSLTLSIFVLAYAIGPLFLGPLSEIFGRVIVLQLSNLFFLAFNIGCGFAKSKGQLIAFRFMSGLGGSAPLSLGGGVLSDVWHAEERGKSISIYSLAPLLGPAGKQRSSSTSGLEVSSTDVHGNSWADCGRVYSREGKSLPKPINNYSHLNKSTDDLEMVLLVHIHSRRRHPMPRPPLPSRDIRP